jgi:hypothetical protein
MLMGRKSMLSDIDSGALTPVHRIVIPVEQLLHVGTPMRLLLDIGWLDTVCGVAIAQ